MDRYKTRTCNLNFGRVLTGCTDSWPGYTRRQVPIDASDPEASGESHYANVRSSSNRRIKSRTVFEIPEQELAAADRYEEVAKYHKDFCYAQVG